jgi:UDP-N-acetylglucosamine acyltransferase
MSTQVDSRAVVGTKATLGEGVTIGPFAIVEDGAVIGDGSSIAHHAFIGTGARIGKNVKIHHGAVIGHAPQDLKYANEPSTCEIGDRTEIREYAVIHRGTAATLRTVIGEDNYLMAFTHVAHDCVLGNKIIMSNAAMLAGHVHVEDFVIIGGITPVHQFVRIGRHAMVGGGLRVPKDVPPYVLAGNAPVCFEGLNSVGLRRRGFSAESIRALGSAYTLLYHSKLNVSQALGKIKEDASLMAFPEVQNMVEFIADSKRGIIGSPRSRTARG